MKIAIKLTQNMFSRPRNRFTAPTPSESFHTALKRVTEHAEIMTADGSETFQRNILLYRRIDGIHT